MKIIIYKPRIDTLWCTATTLYLAISGYPYWYHLRNTVPSTCRTISTATTLMKSKDENTKTPIAFCSLATNLDQASFEETTTPSCHSR